MDLGLCHIVMFFLFSFVPTYSKTCINVIGLFDLMPVVSQIKVSHLFKAVLLVFLFFLTPV